MMTLEYLVHGLGLRGTAPAGPQVINITAGHLQLSPAAAVTGATVAVSFDGGAHWTPATVTRQGAGQFRATFTAPPGALVTLRASASDTLGGSVTESITRAYRTAPAAAGQPAALTAHRLAPQAGHPAGLAARPAGPGGDDHPALCPGAPWPGPVRPALPGADRGQPGACGREGSPAARLGGPRPGSGLPAAGEPAQPPDGGGVHPVPHPAPGPFPGHLPPSLRPARRAPPPAAACGSSTRPGTAPRCLSPGSTAAGIWRAPWTCR